MAKIQVNDIELYYEIHGQGEPLVLIAGFSADHTVWYTVIDELQKHFQVIVFDNRGAGQSSVPEGPYSIDLLADDVAMLCEKLQINHAHFIGNSMGGYILQSLAYRYPKLVKSAVISNSTFVTHTCFHFYIAAQLELMKAEAPQSSLIKASCSWVFSFQFLSQPGVQDELLQLNLENPYPFTVKGYEAQLAAVDAFDSRNWTHQISVPTLVISADQDLIFSEASIQALANKIPNAKYYCFNECGHLPQIEYPEQFIEVVTNFINNESKEQSSGIYTGREKA